MRQMLSGCRCNSTDCPGWNGGSNQNQRSVGKSAFIFTSAMRKRSRKVRPLLSRPWCEALRLGVVLAVNQTHELAHDVHVVPGRAEGVFRDEPSVWENHEVDIGGAGCLRWRGEHREDRG